jgi:DNA mismatch repair protein MutS
VARRPKLKLGEKEETKTSKKTKETPLMEQYNAMKAKYGDAVMLFRVGDFYETFGQDAITAANVLGITLTARNNGGSNVELAGFPFHALDTYLPKLVRAGHRVAVCDQLEKPNKMNKIVRRGVTEVVTPGIITSDGVLNHKQNNYICAVFADAKNGIGIAFMDISTGEFLVSEGDAVAIEKLLQNFQPSEILLPKHQQKEWTARLKENFYTYNIDDWVFSTDYAREKLLNQFEVASLKGFGIEEMTLAQIAAGAILHYVASTEHNNISHVNHIARLQPDKYVWMDRFTIRNLELLQATHPSGVALLQVLDQTTTAMGARLLAKWIQLPLKDRKAIQARHDMVRFFVDDREANDHILTQLKQIGDLERLVSKIPLGKISPRDLRQLARALAALAPIKIILAAAESPQLHAFAERIQLCETMQKRLDTTIIENAPNKTDNGSFVQKGISPALDELRELVHNTQNYLRNIEIQQAQLTGISNLKIGRNDVFGFYFEVTNKHKDRAPIPADWQRKQTLANAERYTSEKLQELEHKILTAEEQIVAEEQRIFAELLADLLDYMRPIQADAQLVAQLDCFICFAQVAIQNNYCRPTLNDDFAIDIKAARHPVIEKQLKIGEEYVPNDIFLDREQQQIMMITGPNMAGKSAILRQTALICLLAQIGCFVPAQEARLGIVDKIFTRVGASDNISSGESTFMVEMNETASILNNISDRSLILLDEIGRGTSTYDGISIAWAIAEYLHHSEARPKTLFATHYHELNQLTEHLPRIKNFNVSTKEVNNRVIFLRRLQEGGTGHSFGIQVARMAGMPKEVVARAKEILVELEKKDIDSSQPNIENRLANMPTEKVQMSFFEAAVDETWERVRQALHETDINRLTPVEAMLRLLEIQKML